MDGRRIFNEVCGWSHKENFLSLFKHFHLSDAEGIDGEGLELGKGIINSTKILKLTLKSNYTKVLEVWQGHLNNGRLYKKELNKLLNIG